MMRINLIWNQLPRGQHPSRLEMPHELEIIQAGPDRLAQLAPLFDAYRQFYGQPADQGVAERFLAERLERQDSVILLACRGPEAVGFSQLYPSFCRSLCAASGCSTICSSSPAAGDRASRNGLFGEP